MTARLALFAALEALEPGDSRLAADVLLSALEELDTPTGAKRHRCPYCRIRFEWPGQVDAHLRVVHDWTEAA